MRKVRKTITYKKKENTSIALPDDLREAIIQTGNSEWGCLTGFVVQAAREKLQRMGYLQEKKPEPVVIKKAEYSGAKPIANFDTL